MSNNKKVSASSDKSENMTYEKAISRLGDIVRTLDGGKLSLDESVKLFEEGASLAKFCEHCLNEAEMKIVRLRDCPSDGDCVSE